MKHAMVLALAALAWACVDAPTQPSLASADVNPLAASFDVLAQEQLAANDEERSEEFRWAALSLRAGVTPSVLEVTIEDKPELYDAFVHAATWASLTQALRPPTHRSLIAWRRSGEVLKVLLVGTFTDSAPVLHPYSLRNASPGVPLSAPVAGATAAYFERGSNTSTTWLGISGAVRLAEHPQPALCPSPNDSERPAGVTCQLTRYGVGLNVLFARTRGRDSREVDPTAPSKRLFAPPQTVAGAKLVFSCLAPLSTGCR
jgi:hypothetical protein